MGECVISPISAITTMLLSYFIHSHYDTQPNYAIPNPKLNHDILRHEVQLRHKPKTIFILLSSHYDFGSSFCLQLRQPKTPKPTSFKLRHSTQLWHTPIAPTQNPKILISIPHILFYLSFHSHDYLIITSPRIST